MGQLGFSEMLVIFIVALLVFGPKKLPELGKSLGKGIREFKKATEELKSSWEEQVKDVAAPLNEVKQDMKADFYKQMEATETAHEAPHTAPEATHPAEPTVPTVPKAEHA